MIIENPALLAEMREPGRCRWCGRHAARRDPAHIKSRGAGFSVWRGNMVALCRDCHTSNHAGNAPTAADLLVAAAVDLGALKDDIEAVNYLVRRLDKDLPLRLLRTDARSLTPEARALFWEAMWEAEHASR